MFLINFSNYNKTYLDSDIENYSTNHGPVYLTREAEHLKINANKLIINSEISIMFVLLFLSFFLDNIYITVLLIWFPKFLNIVHSSVVNIKTYFNLLYIDYYLLYFKMLL